MQIPVEYSKKMDLILSYLAKNENARFKYKQIIDLLNVDIDEARVLHALILKYHNDIEQIISIHNANNIGGKPLYTEKFLIRGGFEAISQQQVKNEKFDNLKLSKSKHRFGFNAWLNKNIWITFALAILAFILALSALLIVVIN